MSTAEPTSSGGLDLMWRRQQVYWHLLFALLVAITAGFVAVDLTGPRRLVALAGIVALALAYAGWGRQALAGRGAPWLVPAYLTASWALFFGLAILTRGNETWALCFGLFPQTGAMLRRRAMVVVITLAVLGLAAVQLWLAGSVREVLPGILLWSGIALFLSLGLGLFVDRIFCEAHDRARMIDELNRTHAALAAAERSRGVYAERERLSQEIHDTLAQGFTWVFTLAQAAESALGRGDLTAVGDRLRLLQETASENLSEARAIVAEMTPGHLQAGTLAQALQRLVTTASAQSGIRGELTVLGEPGPTAANSEVVLLRTAQEAIANVRRHSAAAHFTVTLSYAKHAVVALEVSDDGHGFDPQLGRPGFGLDGAQARASDLGSQLLVHSAPGNGATLMVEVPR